MMKASELATKYDLDTLLVNTALERTHCKKRFTANSYAPKYDIDEATECILEYLCGEMSDAYRKYERLETMAKRVETIYQTEVENNEANARATV